MADRPKQGVRFEPRKELDAGLLRHVQAIRRDPTTDERLAHRNVVLGGDPKAARARIREHRANRKPGRQPKEALEIMIAGPPKYMDDNAWDDGRELAWGRDTWQWIQWLLGPNSIIAAAAHHRDEAAPHIQVLAVPILKDRIGWCRIRDARAATIPGRGPKYAKLQDHYQAEVGARYGLERGVRGSDATHDPVDRIQAAELRIAAAEKKQSQEFDRRERELVARGVEQGNRDADLDRWEFEVADREQGVAERERDVAVRETRSATLLKTIADLLDAWGLAGVGNWIRTIRPGRPGPRAGFRARDREHRIQPPGAVPRLIRRACARLEFSL